MTQRLALAVDFGSTFTKVRIVDLRAGRLAASAQLPTTVRDGLGIGLRRALAELGLSIDEVEVRAGCSSAAGGLRIAAVGLVASLTGEAARRAALGAGGRVVATYAGDLTRADLDELTASAPDLVILAGGTDGGDSRCILTNARRIADRAIDVPVVVAGNRAAADEITDLLAVAGIDAEVVANVLPTLDELCIEPCAAAIRRIFMDRITRARGFGAVAEALGGLVPTPDAVLRGVELAAAAGYGDLLAVDIGGATTDVYSVGDGRPTHPRTVRHGLVEPLVKRTVEGDLGVRVNARAIIDVAEVDDLEARAHAERVSANVSVLPGNERESTFDLVLASSAMTVAARRHAGHLRPAYGPDGRYDVQVGKDLTRASSIIGTGGVLAAASASRAMCGRLLRSARFDPAAPQHLLPQDAAAYVDRDYVLFVAGLLRTGDEDAAKELIRSSLRRVPLDETSDREDCCVPG